MCAVCVATACKAKHGVHVSVNGMVRDGEGRHRHGKGLLLVGGKEGNVSCMWQAWQAQVMAAATVTP